MDVPSSGQIFAVFNHAEEHCCAMFHILPGVQGECYTQVATQVLDSFAFFKE